MTAVAFACGMAAAAVLAGLAWLVARVQIIRSRYRDRVVVTLKAGESFAGVLHSHDHKSLVLQQAEALGAGERGANLPLDGELIVLLADVAYIQKP